MGNIEYIILLLCWLVKSNNFIDIQEVRSRIISCQRTISLRSLPELQVIFFSKIQIGRNELQKTSKRAGYIFQKKSHKKEVRIAKVFGN